MIEGYGPHRRSSSPSAFRSAGRSSVSCCFRFTHPTVGWTPSPQQVEFFEARVRPLLAANCYQCHSAQAKPLFAGLHLDSRAGGPRGSETGPVIVPGEPGQSKLIPSRPGRDPADAPDRQAQTRRDRCARQVGQNGRTWPEDKAPTQAVEASGFDLEAASASTGHGSRSGRSRRQK